MHHLEFARALRALLCQQNSLRVRIGFAYTTWDHNKVNSDRRDATSPGTKQEVVKPPDVASEIAWMDEVAGICSPDLGRRA